ncbi:MAG: lysophospholipid acyltransferase family protein [Sandaracinus sp.]
MRGLPRIDTTLLDGFSPDDARAFVSFDPHAADRLYAWIDRASRLLRVEVHGLEHIPQRGALLVGNHTFGWDAVFVMAAMWRAQRRPIWVLGEHLWWRMPFLRSLAASVGTVDGTHENAEKLLHAGELVLVLPGGMREAMKPRELRYQLLWGKRYGFVRLAARTGVPVVPVASVGTDDLFDFVGNAYERGERWLGRRSIPIPLPSWVLPIPRRAQLRFIVGEPIAHGVAPGDADDEQALRRARREIAGALHELIEIELARRAGIDLGG